MMAARPQALIDEMAGVEPIWDEGAHHWSDVVDLPKPSAEDLARLHHDLRTLSGDECDGEWEESVEELAEVELPLAA